MMKVIVAITGASGGVYARLCLEQLLRAEKVEQIALVVSEVAQKVLQHEGVELPESEKIVRYDNDDMFAPVAAARRDMMLWWWYPPRWVVWDA